MFRERPILDLWQGSEYAHLSISTHWLVEWPLAIHSMRHMKNFVYYRKLRYIQAYSHPVQTFSAILRSFKTLCNYCIFRTLSYSESWYIQNPRYIQNSTILAYSERCVTLAYWEPCYIQKFAIFRILAHLGAEAYSINDSYNITFPFLFVILLFNEI